MSLTKKIVLSVGIFTLTASSAFAAPLTLEELKNEIARAQAYKAELMQQVREGTLSLEEAREKIYTLTDNLRLKKEEYFQTRLSELEAVASSNPELAEQIKERIQLREERKAKMNEIRERMRNASPEERAELRQEMRNIRNEFQFNRQPIDGMEPQQLKMNMGGGQGQRIMNGQGQGRGQGMMNQR